MRNNLVSKIATAYKRMGAEQHDQAPDEDIQNPELDRAFEAMIESNKTQRPPSSAVILPLRPLCGPAKAVAVGDTTNEREYACPECGRHHAEDDSFCARCGTLLQESTALQLFNAQEPSASLVLVEPRPPLVTDSCHCCRDRKQSYLLLAIVVLLLFNTWQEWQQAHPASAPRAGTTIPNVAAARPVRAPTSTLVGLPAFMSPNAVTAGAKLQPPVAKAQHRRNPKRESSEADPEVVWRIPPAKRDQKGNQVNQEH